MRLPIATAPTRRRLRASWRSRRSPGGSLLGCSSALPSVHRPVEAPRAAVLGRLVLVREAKPCHHLRRACLRTRLQWVGAPRRVLNPPSPHSVLASPPRPWQGIPRSARLPQPAQPAVLVAVAAAAAACRAAAHHRLAAVVTSLAPRAAPAARPHVCRSRRPNSPCTRRRHPPPRHCGHALLHASGCSHAGHAPPCVPAPPPDAADRSLRPDDRAGLQPHELQPVDRRDHRHYLPRPVFDRLRPSVAHHPATSTAVLAPSHPAVVPYAPGHSPSGHGS